MRTNKQKRKNRTPLPFIVCVHAYDGVVSLLINPSD